ncbi:hypothetical protein D3C76_1367080 [compost metagenome]
MYGVGRIPHQYQPFAGKIAGIAGGERDGAAGPLHLAQSQPPIKGGGELAIEPFVIQGAQRLGPHGGHRPDDGAEVGLPQGQEGERAVRGEDLARHRLMGLLGAYRRYQGVVAVIPAGERDVGLAAHPGVGAIGRHHQFGREGAAVVQQQH